MQGNGNRQSLLDLSRQSWDLLIIGGGITGAGVFWEASRLGLKSLLVERDDFAAGTSSHSAKLIHGGLHYLSRFQLGLARESVRERKRLLRDEAGLIDTLPFTLPLDDCEHLEAYVKTFGLSIYQAISGSFHRPRHIRGTALDLAVPGLDTRFSDAICYSEGQTDDARLTLRAIASGRNYGGTAQNYTAAIVVTRNRKGTVAGAMLHDDITDEYAEIQAKVVVNAAGPWSDDVRAGIGRSRRQRLVGGSHIVIPHKDLPIEVGMAVYHPESGLPLYLVPWRNVTLVGTTHVDAGPSANRPARATEEETDYLLRGVRSLFPDIDLTVDDLQATFSGYRPIVDTHTNDLSRASRDYGIWEEDGLITVTGGKLTTYRSMAEQVMRKVAHRLSAPIGLPTPSTDGLHKNGHLSDSADLTADDRRLAAIYGEAGRDAMSEMSPAERTPLPESGGVTLAEIRWAARAEDVVHLDDLLSRRVRLSLMAPQGGTLLLDQVEPIAREELGWDADRWAFEASRYREIWRAKYSVPGQRQVSIQPTDDRMRCASLAAS